MCIAYTSVCVCIYVYAHEHVYMTQFAFSYKCALFNCIFTKTMNKLKMNLLYATLPPEQPI